MHREVCGSGGLRNNTQLNILQLALLAHDCAAHHDGEQARCEGVQPDWSRRISQCMREVRPFCHISAHMCARHVVYDRAKCHKREHAEQIASEPQQPHVEGNT